MHKLLTLTGIDARTDTKWVKTAIRSLIRKSGYSAVEFGILRSPKVDQSPRYPGRDVINGLLSAGYPGDFSFHLCGRYARMVHDLEWTELCDIIDFNKVGRVQVNSTECDEKAILTLMRFSIHIGRPVIMQWRGETFPCVPAQVHLLQDRSGGRGITETLWSTPDELALKAKRTVGYAGGLGPHNVGAALKKIVKSAGGNQFWIDCESSLRTDDWFDTAKADAMIEAVRVALPDMFQGSRHE
jgi:phosphoribosylanthranilate isomerase